MVVHKMPWPMIPHAVLCGVYPKRKTIWSSPRDEDVTCKRCLHHMKEQKVGHNLPYNKGGWGRKPFKNIMRGVGDGI